MNLLRRFARRLRFLFRRDRLEAEMAEEMRFHLEQRTADLTADGLAETEARYVAQRRFGNTGVLQERARDTWGWGSLERALKDLRLAFRQLASNPGFTLLAIVTLGLGIGANTSMFSVLNGVMLKRLPYANLDQLDRIYRGTPQHHDGNISPADFRDFVQAKSGYGDVAAYTPADVSLAERGRPAEMAYAASATSNFFSLLGVRPQLGRDFRPGEDTPGRDRVVVLSSRTWLKRFNGRTDVIGRTVRIDGEAHEIIGVLPASFNDWRFLGMIDFFRPLALSAEQAGDRKASHLRVIGRRDPTILRPKAPASSPISACASRRNFRRSTRRPPGAASGSNRSPAA